MRGLGVLLSSGLLVCLVGAAPAAPATGAPPAPTDSTVRGGCTGGPGRVVLTASRPDPAGDVAVVVVARRLPDGFRWRGLVAARLADEPDDLDFKEFRRTSSDGGWSVSATLELGDYQGPVTYGVFSFERGNGSPLNRACIVDVFVGKRHFGIAWCSVSVIQLLAAHRTAEGALVVRYLQEARPDSRWRLEIRAVDAAGSVNVIVDDQASPRGLLTTKAVFDGVADPRLFVVATNDRGRHCGIGLNPANTAPGRLVSFAELRAAAKQAQLSASRPR